MGVGKKETTQYYFHKQRYIRPLSGRRQRKNPDDLPQVVRLSHLNPRVANYLSSKERAAETSYEEAIVNVDRRGSSQDGPFSLVRRGSISILTPANGKSSESPAQPTEPPAQPKSELDWDAQKIAFNKIRGGAICMLRQLSGYMYGLKEEDEVVSSSFKIPKSLEYSFLMMWKELSSEATDECRVWQTQACQNEAKTKEAEAKAKAAEAVAAAEQAALQAEVMHQAEQRRTNSLARRGSILNQPTLATIPSSKSPAAIRRQPLPRTNSQVPQSPLRTQTAQQSRASKAGSEMTQASGAIRRSASGAQGGRRGSLHHPDDISMISESNQSLTEAQKGYYFTTINFVLSSKESDEKGWICSTGDHRLETVVEWAKLKLMTPIQNRKLEEVDCTRKGYKTKPNIVFFGEPGAWLRKPPKQNEIEWRHGLIPVLPEPEWNKAETDRRKIWMTMANDGTISCFYPSGNLAVLIAHYGAKRLGYSVFIYDDVTNSAAAESMIEESAAAHNSQKSQKSEMLGCFNSRSIGGIFHSNGRPRFTCTTHYCCTQDENGVSLKKFRWPITAGAKLPQSVFLKLNDFLTFKCVSRQEMSLSFVHGSSEYQFELGFNPEVARQNTKELDEEQPKYLICKEKYTSQSAKDLQKPPPEVKKKASKKVFKKTKLANIADEVQEEVTEDLDVTLQNMQTKIKKVCDTWLEHYRGNLGIDGAPPSQQPADSARKYDLQRPTKSAAGPIVSRQRSDVTSKSLPRPFTTTSLSVGTPKTPRTPLSAWSSPSHIVRDSSRSATTAESSAQSAEWTLVSCACPLSVRAALLGISPVPCCACSRLQPPVVSDLEYDAFLWDIVPAEQVVVVAVVDSTKSTAASGRTCQSMLDGLYRKQNRTRPTPCTLSRHDPYRVVTYDLGTAANSTPCSQALLLRRHNLRPGVCLMYLGGRLLFANNMFNGYGANRLRDFYKQLAFCKEQGKRGFALPPDFRFSATHNRPISISADTLDFASLSSLSANSFGNKLESGLSLPRLKTTMT